MPARGIPAQSAEVSRDYRRALERYEQGQYASGVNLLLTLDTIQLQAVVDAETADAFSAQKDRRLEAAAVLLLDSAGTASLRRPDTRSLSLRFRAAKVMEKRMALGRPGDAVRNWYLADAAFLEGRHDYSIAGEQLADARSAFPRDARILMASGSVLETGGVKFDDAADYYRASLAIDGSNVQCRLRLARVLTLFGKAADALAELDKMAAPADERLSYLRELFRAKALASLKRPPEAEKKYLEALQWNTQAPYLGLAESLAARGDDAAARQVIAKLLAANVVEEPWDSYLRGQWPHFFELIDDARRSLK